MVQAAIDRFHGIRLGAALVACLVGVSACATEAANQGGVESAIVLGPVDGMELPPTDLDRVAAGQMAPDFTLTSLAGPPVRLSSFRGAKDVVLVFYRGHW